jgi:chromosome partitioning protein
MSRVIAVACQKGGVGKTSTAVNLAAALGRAGRRVLVVDLDAQANATEHFGLEPASLKATVYDALLGGLDFGAIVCDTSAAGVKLAPANEHLAAAELELSGRRDRAGALKAALSGTVKAFDWTFIDCGPSLGLLTVNAFAAAGAVLVPLQCEHFALKALARLLDTIEQARAEVNPQLELLGVVATQFDSRRILDREVFGQLKRSGVKVFKAIIRQNVSLAEAPISGRDIFTYAPGSTGAEDYAALARELMRERP